MSRRLTAGLFVMLGTLWGSSFVLIEVGLPYFPPVLFAALRFDVAGALVFAYAVSSTTYWRPRSRADWITILVSGGLLIAGHHALLYVGQQYVPGAVAAIVISLGPILTAVFASLILTTRLTGIGVVGFGFGIAGVVLVSDPEPANLLTADVVGVGIVFLAAACFALGAVLTRPFRTTMPVRSLQAWALLVGGLFLHVISAFRGETFAAIEWTDEAVVALAYLGLVTGAIAFLIYFELLDRLGPARINLVGYLEPISATLVSWLLLGHLIDPQTALGLVTIVVGLTLIQRDAIRTTLRRYGEGSGRT